MMNRLIVIYKVDKTPTSVDHDFVTDLLIESIRMQGALDIHLFLCTAEEIAKADGDDYAVLMILTAQQSLYKTIVCVNDLTPEAIKADLNEYIAGLDDAKTYVCTANPPSYISFDLPALLTDEGRFGDPGSDIPFIDLKSYLDGIEHDLTWCNDMKYDHYEELDVKKVLKGGDFVNFTLKMQVGPYIKEVELDHRLGLMVTNLVNDGF